jgi:hypothetical protein
MSPTAKDGLVLKGWVEMLAGKDNKAARNAIGYFEAVPRLPK